VPAPPGAPEDGLYVESAPDGSPSAIGAVSYYTGGNVDATLTLDVVEGSSADEATLAACPADGGWDAVQNGRWDRRPEYDPDGCTLLGEASAGVVTFAIPASAHQPGSAFLAVAIVPAAGSSAFSTAFEPPTEASLVTTEPASGSTEPEPAADPAYEPAAAPTAAPTFTTPSPSSFEVPTSPVVDSGDGGEVAADAPSRPAAATVPVDEEDRAAQIAAIAVLALMGAGLWALATRPQRAPRLLGSLATEEAAPVVVHATAAARGLGRFARPRSAPPTAI
jgi:hypothetical protein